MTPPDSVFTIEFSKLGKPSDGYISVGEFDDQMPFSIKRVFWTYYTPEDIVRGRHAHHNTEQVLVAVAGRITLTTEMLNGDIQTFVLDKPELGVYMPKYCWHTMQYSHTAVQMVLSSTKYDPEDYIRDYDELKLLAKKS